MLIVAYMAIRHSGNRDSGLNSPSARSFWKQSYLAAELTSLLRSGHKVAPAGLAHLAAEYADASLEEYRRRFGSKS